MMTMTIVYWRLTFCNGKKKRTTIKNYLDVVKSYDDRTFISHFRLGRDISNKIAMDFGNSQTYLDLLKNENSRCCISPEKHILIFLWYAGHQTASFRDLSDRFDVSLSSLHAVITRVCMFLTEIAPKVIKHPTEARKQETSAFYLNSKQFPHVIGSIDGTHISIDKPDNRAVDYFNRKDYHSIQMQGVCDENLNFFDVFIGYPGSVHDARVFRNSSISENLESLCGNEYLILGDSAYPLLSNLITPYRDNGHLTRNQKQFNRRLSSVRVSIEHAFGLLKQRFRQLFHLKLREHRRQCMFIHACCVLHNLANKDDADILNSELPPENSQPVQDLTERPLQRGSVARERLLSELFPN